MGVDGGGDGGVDKHCWATENPELLGGEESEIEENMELEQKVEVRSWRNVEGEGEDEGGEETVEEYSSESQSGRFSFFV